MSHIKENPRCNLEQGSGWSSRGGSSILTRRYMCVCVFLCVWVGGGGSDNKYLKHRQFLVLVFWNCYIICTLYSNWGSRGRGTSGPVPLIPLMNLKREDINCIGTGIVIVLIITERKCSLLFFGSMNQNVLGTLAAKLNQDWNVHQLQSSQI